MTTEEKKEKNRLKQAAYQQRIRDRMALNPEFAREVRAKRRASAEVYLAKLRNAYNQINNGEYVLKED